MLTCLGFPSQFPADIFGSSEPVPPTRAPNGPLTDPAHLYLRRTQPLHDRKLIVVLGAHSSSLDAEGRSSGDSARTFPFA